MHSFFKDLKRSFVFKVIGLSISFGIQIFIARAIGIGNYGVWNTAISWMQIIFIVSLGGNIKSLLRSASANRNEAFDKLINLLIQVSLTYILLYSIFWGGFSLTGYIDSPEFLIAMIIAFFLGLMRIMSKFGTSMVQAVQKNYLSIFNNRIILPIIKAVSIGSLFLLIGNEITILASYPIAESVTGATFFYFVLKNYPYKDWTWGFHFSFNFHFWVNDITKTLLPFINIALLSFIITESDIGGYSASYRIGEFLMFFTAIFISFSPVIVQYIKDDKWIELQKAYLSINKLLLVIVYPFFFFLMVFSNVLLSLFGQGFSEYSLILQLLIVGVYMDAVTGPIGEMLNMSGNEHIEKNINVGITILNVTLLFILGFYFGVIGAAIAFAIPRAIGNCLKLFQVNRILKIKTIGIEHGKIILLQVLALLPFLFIKDNIYQIILFVSILLTYGLLIYKFGWLSIKDLKILKAI